MSVEDTQPLITHLIELRKRLLNCIIAVIVIFLCLVYFANDIYHLVSAPLIKQLPQGSTMIATDVASPFFKIGRASRRDGVRASAVVEMVERQSCRRCTLEGE